MKLSRVVLARAIKLPGMDQPDAELTDTQCPGLRIDFTRGVVVFGDSNIERPLSRVEEWERDNEGLLCPECEAEFSNSKALGSHRRHKHDVKGAA